MTCEFVEDGACDPDWDQADQCFACQDAGPSKAGGVVLMGPGDNEAHCGVCKEVMLVPTPMPLEAFGPWCAYAEARHGRCSRNLLQCASEADPTTSPDERTEADGRTEAVVAHAEGEPGP